MSMQCRGSNVSSKSTVKKYVFDLSKLSFIHCVYQIDLYNVFELTKLTKKKKSYLNFWVQVKPQKTHANNKHNIMS